MRLGERHHLPRNMLVERDLAGGIGGISALKRVYIGLQAPIGTGRDGPGNRLLPGKV